MNYEHVKQATLDKRAREAWELLTRLPNYDETGNTTTPRALFREQRRRLQAYRYHLKLFSELSLRYYLVAPHGKLHHTVNCSKCLTYLSSLEAERGEYNGSLPPEPESYARINEWAIRVSENHKCAY